MEWLRSVDLAEYAPNLRGSGVHGGLMVRNHFVLASLLFRMIDKFFLFKWFILFVLSGAGTSLQCGDDGSAAKYSS